MIAIASKGHLMESISTERNSARYKNSFSLLDADTTADTQELGDEGNFVGRFHLDTQFAYNSTGSIARAQQALGP